jgi:hypothetical protein
VIALDAADHRRADILCLHDVFTLHVKNIRHEQVGARDLHAKVGPKVVKHLIGRTGKRL